MQLHPKIQNSKSALWGIKMFGIGGIVNRNTSFKYVKILKNVSDIRGILIFCDVWGEGKNFTETFERGISFLTITNVVTMITASSVIILCSCILQLAKI